ncbi:MAG TPA: replication initiator protein A [Thiobacillaceae bacterium]|nr:replication initiator protein A [Thiobacillaceae bacterium]
MDNQLSLFECSVVDPALRDNRDAMAYPFLALQKQRTRPIEYNLNGVQVSVAADRRFSIATIWDWDVVIFASSHLNEAIESKRKTSPHVVFAPHDCLKQIARGTSGRHYHELAQAIRRLHATMVITNIRQADQPELGMERGFHWLGGYALPKKYSRYHTRPDGITQITPRDPEGAPDPARPWEIILHSWLYNAILRRGDILAVHPDYFQLTGGLERWLYRLARKSVPDKAAEPAMLFGMDTLHALAGVTRELKKFAFDIRQIAAAQPMPEYGVRIFDKDKRELVMLYRDPAKPCRPPRGRRLTTMQDGC